MQSIITASIQNIANFLDQTALIYHLLFGQHLTFYCFVRCIRDEDTIMLNRKIFNIVVATVLFTACAKPLNTQINSDFVQQTQGKSPEQLATMLYQQAYAKYHNRMIDRCTKMEIRQEKNRVIFDNFLLDAQCGNVVHQMSATQLAQYLRKGKQFRVNEIRQVPTAKAILNGGVIQIYRYYLMPERRLVGEFQIDQSDIR